MLIRKPVAQVFEAMVDPSITSCFWFSKGSVAVHVPDALAEGWASR